LHTTTSLKTIVVEHTKQNAKIHKKNEYILIMVEKLHFSDMYDMRNRQLDNTNELTTIV